MSAHSGISTYWSGCFQQQSPIGFMSEKWQTRNDGKFGKGERVQISARKKGASQQKLDVKGRSTCNLFFHFLLSVMSCWQQTPCAKAGGRMQPVSTSGQNTLRATALY